MHGLAETEVIRRLEAEQCLRSHADHRADGRQRVRAGHGQLGRRSRLASGAAVLVRCSVLWLAWRRRT